MKKKLLSFFATVFFSITAFSQTTAYDAPDIFQCNNEVFDLTVQDPYVLGNQNPADFSVTYFETEQDANNNTSAIADPTFYITNWGEVVTIYARVDAANDESFDISTFEIGFGGTYLPVQDDAFACGSYILPGTESGNYYTGPGGTGTMLAPGQEITVNQTIYIYNNFMGICPAETSFEVYISNLDVPELAPLLGCDPDSDGIATFDLSQIHAYLWQNVSQDIEVNFYTTYADAQAHVNAIPNVTSYTSSNAVIYVGIDDGMCYYIRPLELQPGECTGNVLSGVVNYDSNGNGCDSGSLPAGNIMVSNVVGNQVLYTFTNASGEYMFENVPDGANLVSIVNLPNSIYTAAPSVYTVAMPGDGTGNNFCLSVPNPVTDVSVYIFPLSAAIPGMQVTYAVVYQNLGSFPEEVSVNLVYDPVLMTYNYASPSMLAQGNGLSLDNVTIMPFQTQTIYVTFTVSTPPSAQIGDIITLTADIDISTDDNWANNEYTLDQSVVNSYDPNDISVREGEFITLEQAGEYLHYTIRFQNEGTANAQNIRIESSLDNNLDWSTFEPIGASHAYNVALNGNDLTFRFNNINLAYASADEPGSHGWVAYKIKPKSTVAVGDMMAASAGIYFDFNTPILTNTATTTVQTTAGTDEFNKDAFVVYPNPVSGIVNLRIDNLNGSADITFTDVLGKTVLSSQVNQNTSSIDLSSLKSGVYFITMASQGKSVTQKIIVK